ncbi:hypothetical protein PV10_01196 [Exophiala mesophila]|uniref:Transcription initiation factor IIF subunit alpha n=1 Tax=Exophiala mesophila TaxID=212818 RepID=A0A0D1ZU44_EXOME|nr:uncharacterized protein PV10_01196 [Exophiala mesophila]KIV97444.1 hypothetical protein PV10_01196 [Exophiala mesophila]
MNPGGVPPGGPANRPQVPAPTIKRKKPAADPFFKASRKPALTGNLQSKGGLPLPVNGHIPKPQQLRKPLPHPPRTSSPATLPVPENERVSGFSDPRVTAEGIPYKDYKLVTTKRDLINAARYHILQLAGEKVLDIRNESEFPKPARLHRRDPKAQPPGPQPKEETGPEPKDGLNAVEREELGRRKEIRQKEREANLAQIAPSQKTGSKSTFKKKTQQVWLPNRSVEQKRRDQTAYEEKLPWHLEDFDNKHTLVGHHQPGSISTHAAFLYEPGSNGTDGKFRLIPVEKLYQFKPKRELAQQMSIEEVEAAMKKRGTDPEWLVRQRESRIAEAGREAAARQAKSLFSGAQKQNIAGRGGEDADLDFEDDFADDEEGDLFADKDEDEKIAEKRIKEDQLTANFLDFKDIKEYDEAEERERKEAEAKKRNFRDLRKALERRERNYNHGSDSDESSSTDSEEERERIERERLENIKREEDAANKSGLNSGANTPSGRKEKHATSSDREGSGIKKSASSRTLKRPGSPNLSDASGTDASTRKKKIKSKHLSSTQPTPSVSRPMSPANVPSSSAPGGLDPNRIRQRGRGGAGAGSDTDNVASDREGGAMSDASRARQKLKLKMSASPPPGGGTSTPQPSSRAGSPARSPSAMIGVTELPSKDEIRKAIPQGGIAIKDLMKVVAHPKDRRAEFVALVKEVARMDQVSRLLVLK